MYRPVGDTAGPFGIADGFYNRIPTASLGEEPERRCASVHKKTAFSAKQIAFAGILGAITVVLGSTPIGFIQIPPISITVMHIPTIIAGVMGGPVIGGIVGLMFGIFSMYQAQTAINPLDKLIFSNPLIALVPRILVGIVAYYVFTAFRGKKGTALLTGISSLMVGYTGYSLSSQAAPVVRGIIASAAGVLAGVGIYQLQKRFGHGPALAAAVGSLTNTVLVLGLIVVFGFVPGKIALGVGLLNGLPEATVAVILTDLVYRATSGFIAR